MASKRVPLTAELIHNFSDLFLKSRYDGAADTPEVHDEWWEMCCSRRKLVAIAAPRGHAKTTAMTLAYTLTAALFRHKKYIIIVGNNEDTATELLGMIRNELKTNDNIKEVFGVKDKWDKDLQTELIVNFEDGHRFRILARGSQQRIRGRNWDNTRPDLIVIDDLEDDEAVESSERRAKLKSWVMKALIPSLSASRGQVRFIGTILHEDSLLMNAMKSKAWLSKLYKAHKSFDDFSELLWPEVWSEEALREVRDNFVDNGDAEGYSQEYLNDPSDLRHAFFRREDILPMTPRDHNKIKTYYVGADFALSDKTHSDYSAIVVGGYDEEGILHIVEIIRMRTDDVAEIVEQLFYVLDKWNPEYFIWEKGTLSNAILPPFMAEMTRRNKFSQVETFPASSDKRSRAHPIQHRLRTGAVRIDTESEWFETLWDEMRKFPKSTYKDQIDALAWLGFCINEFVEAPTQEEIDEEEWGIAWDESGLAELDYTGTGY